MGTQEGQYGYSQISYPTTDSSALKYRLDTSELILQIDMFLNNEIEIPVRQGDVVMTARKKLGQPRANPSGVSSILSWLQGAFNSATVQGNFPSDKHGDSQLYRYYIREFRINLTTYIYTNLYEWDISENDAPGIINMILNTAIPFFSRLIDNKERDSYTQTFKTTESHMVGSKPPITK